MKFLITAGPTREPIDPVRYISNRSSGKMGYAIANAAVNAGHEVTLISGPVCIPAPEAATLVSISTAEEMFYAVHQHIDSVDILVMCAAVADYTPAQIEEQKIKKDSDTLTLKLVRTRDILRSLPPPPRKYFVVGFAAETHDVDAYAKKKLIEKKCDLLIANDVSRINTGFESDENEVTFYFQDGTSRSFERAKKIELAKHIVLQCESMRVSY